MCGSSLPWHADNIQAICVRKAARYCNIVPALDEAIEWEVDTDGTVLIDMSIARGQLQRLHQEIIAQRAATERASDDPGYGMSLQTGTCRPYSLKRVKEHIPRTMHHIVKLWDEGAGDFTYDEVRIAELLTADAAARQGSTRGRTDRGEELLRHATLDLSNVRMHVHDDEILNAILEGKQSAAPGPNGVRGHPYHEHASLLIAVFREAFEEIVAGDPLLDPFTEGLLRPIGKTSDPCTFKQIRDLELPNFDRKVIERLFCLLIDECAGRSVSQSQVACLKGRDIAMHVLKFNDVFEEAVSRQSFLATLSLDCSKGFNRMSHSWVERVLVAAGCPHAMVTALMHMISPTVAYLVHNQRRMSRLEFACGLRQGGPLSAILYILAVDPLLCAFRSVPDVDVVLGFVDDWLAAARTPLAIPALQALCDEFEVASGQVFNTDKSAVLTSRPLTESEAAIVRTQWPTCRVVNRHKIVGVLYGANVRPEERYSEALSKMDTRLEQLRAVNMSLNMRIVSANVFLLSHFAFTNRFFMMPECVVSEVRNKMRQFVTRLSVGAVDLWTHCLPLVKAKVALVDIRLQNIVLLICTAHAFGRDLSVGALDGSRWMSRCCSCMSAAHWFFYESTGSSVESVVSKGVRGIYQALLQSEMPGCSEATSCC